EQAGAAIRVLVHEAPSDAIADASAASGERDAQRVDRGLGRLDAGHIGSERDDRVELSLRVAIAPALAIGHRRRRRARPELHHPRLAIGARAPAPLALEVGHALGDDAIVRREHDGARGLDASLASFDLARPLLVDGASLQALLLALGQAAREV